MIRHLLATLTLMTALVLPLPALAQADASVAPGYARTVAGEDTRIEDLRALVPADLAGLPLRDALELVTGEELVEHMGDEERAVFEAMLTAAGKGIEDYVAASAIIPLNETDALVIQPHRVVGIDAQSTTATWVEILGLNTRRLNVVEASISGHDVYVVSDDAEPTFPRLHIFAAGDVVWMVAVRDDAVAAEAVRVLSEASGGAGGPE